MNSLADRFRRWYEYERDCNAKALDMLASVPTERRSAPEFEKAVGRMAHLNAARCRWGQRLGILADAPALFPSGIALADLAGMIASTERAWADYLSRLDEAELARELEWVAGDGHRYRWNVEGILTQLLGHAPYHRGQIAQLVALLGGKAVDTDYILWCKLPKLDTGGG